MFPSIKFYFKLIDFIFELFLNVWQREFKLFMPFLDKSIDRMELLCDNPLQNSSKTFEFILPKELFDKFN